MSNHTEASVLSGSAKLNLGDTVTFADGGTGVVLPSTAAGAQQMQEIAPGQSMIGSMRARDYDDFFTVDPVMHQYMTKAASISRATPFALDFFQDDITTSTGIPDDAIESMNLARRYFREDPIAGKVIELMAQFSVAGMRHQLKDENVRQFFDDWVVSVNFEQVLKQVFLEYYLTGNVYVMKTLVNFKQGQGNPDFKYKVDPELQKQSKAETAKIERALANYKRKMDLYLKDEISYEDMYAIRAETIEQVQGARKHVWSKSMIPGTYTVLDPTAVEMDGPEEFGLAIMKYKASDNLKETISSPQTPAQKQVILTLPKDFVSQIRGGATEVILDPNITSRITRMKPDYQQLAFPLMHRAFRALHMKNRLRELDSATVDTIISQMVIVKVGDKDFPAKRSHIEAVTQAWLEAVQTKTLYLFWNHAIDVQRVEVNTEILGQEKYEQWNTDIRDAFGISPLLLGRVEGSATSGYVSVKGFIENLEQGRQDILDQFVYPEYHGIAAAMGFQGFPEVKFDKFNLQDEAMMKKTVMALVQSGLISYETGVEELGYSWKQELERHEEELKLKEDMVIPFPQGGGTNNMSDGTGDGETPQGGRPSGKPSNKQPSRKPRIKDKTATSK